MLRKSCSFKELLLKRLGQFKFCGEKLTFWVEEFWKFDVRNLGGGCVEAGLWDPTV